MGGFFDLDDELDDLREDADECDVCGEATQFLRQHDSSMLCDDCFAERDW